MNRLFGGHHGKNKGPSATNLQALKSKQVESLRKVGASETLRDVEYRVVVRQGVTNITIIIFLPPGFPNEKPVLTVQPAVTHDWVDSQMKVVGCRNINDFSMHSDLGSAVQAVLDEFKVNPPVVVPQHYILGVNTPTISAMQTPSVAPGADYANLIPYVVPTNSSHTSQPGMVPPPLPPRRTPGVAGDSTAAPVPNFPMPNLLKEFPALKEMKLHELHELVEEDDKIIEMVQKVSDLVLFTQQREALANECIQLAKSNLSKKPEIENLREEIARMNKEYEELLQQFEKHCQHQASLSVQYHPSNIQSNLKVAVMEADEDSEKMAERFFEEEIKTDEFLKAFMEKRTLCHLRRAKEEKLNQIINSQGLH